MFTLVSLLFRYLIISNQHCRFRYSGSSIIWTSITIILAIPGFIENSKYIIRLSGLFTKNSLQYHDPNNRGLGFFYDYRELFLDLVIPIIEDLLYFFSSSDSTRTRDFWNGFFCLVHLHPFFCCRSF